MEHTHKKGQSFSRSFSFWTALLKSQKGVVDQFALIGVALILTGFIARYPFTSSPAPFSEEYLKQAVEAIDAQLAEDQQPTVQDYLNNTREAIANVEDPKTTPEKREQTLNTANNVIKNGAKNDSTGMNQQAADIGLSSVAASQQTTAAAKNFLLILFNATNTSQYCGTVQPVTVVATVNGNSYTLAPGGTATLKVKPGTHTIVATYVGYSTITTTVTVEGQTIEPFTW